MNIWYHGKCPLYITGKRADYKTRRWNQLCKMEKKKESRSRQWKTKNTKGGCIYKIILCKLKTETLRIACSTAPLDQALMVTGREYTYCLRQQEFTLKNKCSMRAGRGIAPLITWLSHQCSKFLVFWNAERFPRQCSASLGQQELSSVIGSTCSLCMGVSESEHLAGRMWCPQCETTSFNRGPRRAIFPSCLQSMKLHLLGEHFVVFTYCLQN